MTKLPIAKENLKAPVDNLYFEYKNIHQNNEFWHTIPNYSNITKEQFLDWKWQATNSITKVSKLFVLIKDLTPESFIKDVEAGFNLAPMSLRVSPYILSLINWDDPFNDPLRIQFIPVASRLLPDHPALTLDSLHEQEDSPVPGLTHRYKDKVLFLPLNTCPVYCRFCTRSYAVGPDSEQVEKLDLRVDEQRWEQCFEYIKSRPEIEDVVISGGDAYSLKASQIIKIGTRLLETDNVRRMRFATKGPAVMPMKLLSDPEWADALCSIVERGRTLGKDVVLHTHFNHPSEITWVTQQAIQKLFERGVFVRNQCVLQRNVNNSVDTMGLLIKRLGYINVHPYYVYVHDMVKGVEDLRTTLNEAIQLEKILRGSTAGFNMPNFIIDAPEGGGKRLVTSHEAYNESLGISLWKAPAVKNGKTFVYFDPMDLLSPVAQEKWKKYGKDKLIKDMLEFYGC